jgi:hypothetical protein
MHCAADFALRRHADREVLGSHAQNDLLPMRGSRGADRYRNESAARQWYIGDATLHEGEEKDLRITHDGATNCDALPLPARKLAGLAV